MAKRFIGGGEIVSDVAPAGSVTAFAGEVPPDGWLLCDGSVLNTSDYPKLSTVLNGAWDNFAHPVDGTPTVGGGQFALPNMKGLYLAGAGNSGGDARSLGVFQTDNFTSHSHDTYVRTADDGDPAANEVFSFMDVRKGKYGSQAFVRSRASGSSETRPVTAPVNYIIKY